MNHLQHINPPTLSDALAVGYSQVVVASPGKLAFIAGQVGWDEKGIMAGNGDFAAQAKKALENVAVALKEAGASPDDVVQMKYFVVGLNRERVGHLTAAIRELNLFSRDTPPTGAVIGVECLARAEFLIEIEAIAALPE